MRIDVGLYTEYLISYARANLGLGFEDSIYARNQILAEYGGFAVRQATREQHELQSEILNPLIAGAIERGIISESQALLFETRLMGFVTPMPSTVSYRFGGIEKKDGIEAATKYLYDISIKSNYIRLASIKKNISWPYSCPKGDIYVTINLAKPEKSAKSIEQDKLLSENRYPKCALCLDNIGFCGDATRPARQTLRAIPLNLNGENWHLQYSPYLYYDEHCIAFSDSHVPMKITGATFVRLLDFVERFPHYFMGSNADLPIVGGSILTHDHYQGGKKVLPMFARPVRSVRKLGEVSIGIRDWYNSVVHIEGTDKRGVIELAEQVRVKWKEYTNAELGILAKTTAEHNTITPIATFEDGKYCLDLILRNNRTDDKHPFGIYHPTEDMHNIKKEGIGLIEAMGLFILPGRLKSEINGVIEALTAEKIDFARINDSALAKHLGMIAQLATTYGTSQKNEDALHHILNYINEVCVKILQCTAVFKDDKESREYFEIFVSSFR